jgi:predicted Zn-dependent peptidase
MIVVLVLFAVPAANATVHEYRLENGMRVLVKEDHRAPVALMSSTARPVWLTCWSI